MNVTAKIFSDEDYKSKYYAKIASLEAQRSMFVDFSKRLKEADMKRQKAESKKRRRSGVLVNGATSKDDIRRLQRVLRQKISEVLTEDGDHKLKQVQVNDLVRKLESLGRILSDIERIEREQIKEKRLKQKKGATEAVYLTSDNLTINKNGTVDVTVTGFGAAPQNTAGIDVLAGLQSAGAADVSAAADVPVTVDLVV